MRYVQLSDVANINMGQSPSSSSYNSNVQGLPFFQGNADFGDINPIPRYWCTEPTKIAEKDDILLSVRAPIGALNIANERCCIGRGLAAITPKENVIQKFLMSCLRYKVGELQSKGTGSTFKAIKKSTLYEVQIPLPLLDEQHRIADTLDHCCELIDIRKKQLDELDTLVKSRFVEMFGDPVENPMGWEVNPVIKYCNFMVPGRNKPKSFTGKTPWITIDDLVVNGYTEKSKQKLGLTKEEIIFVKRKTIPAGSVIMSCVGNLGICSIAAKPLIINQQLHSFQCKEQINNVFLMHYLGFRTDYMIKMASSTTVLYMNKSVCNSIPVFLPPLSLQNEFADFVTKTETIRENLQKSLESCEILYKSKMQEFFMPQE